MEFISIGPYCATADILKDNNLRENAYPFDYIFSSLELIKHSIKNKFKVFLDKKYYKDGYTDNCMHHLFYSNFIDTEILRKHHIANNVADIANNLTKREIFLHHNLLANEETYLAFFRRCKRLLKLIKENKKIVFVYYNCYTTDFSDLINFYHFFSDKSNIYILGIFKNNLEKRILYENKNCKIYQNYDIPIIFDEVKKSF
jgi:hypothetical protein